LPQGASNDRLDRSVLPLEAVVQLLPEDVGALAEDVDLAAQGELKRG
jgi:hypothetical protein